MTELKPRHDTGKHTCHLDHLPYLDIFVVYCNQGCDLGTSALQESYTAAVKRAELHESLHTQTGVPRS